MKNLMNSRTTPYNRDYGSCRRTDASLVVYSGDIDPDDLTQNFNYSPSRVSKKGEMKANSEGFIRESRLNIWRLGTKGVVRSLDLRDHLDWLMDQIERFEADLMAIQENEGVTMKVHCIWVSRGEGGPTLWPEQMLRLSKLNLECVIEFYYDPDEVS